MPFGTNASKIQWISRLTYGLSIRQSFHLGKHAKEFLNIDICFTFLPSPALEKAPQRSRTILLPGLHVLSVGGAPDQEPFHSTSQVEGGVPTLRLARAKADTNNALARARVSRDHGDPSLTYT